MDFRELTDKIESFIPITEEIEPHIIELMYLATGLTGEAGEFANLVKKLARGDSLKKIASKLLREQGIDEAFVNHPAIDPYKTVIEPALLEEVAGTFIYLELICRALDYTLEEVVLLELDKIAEKRAYKEIALYKAKGWEAYRERKKQEGKGTPHRDCQREE